MLEMKNLKKTFAVALAALVMSLPMANQALAAPVALPQAEKQLELKMNHGPQGGVHRGPNMHRPVRKPVVHRSGGYHEVRPHHNPPPRRDHYRGSHHHSSHGNFVAGAIVGAIIGAVVADSNRSY